MTLEGNVLKSRAKVNGAFTHSVNTTYNATTMQWWRIREAAGTVYSEVAADNAGQPGTWTTIDSFADPAFGMTSLNVGLDAGTWGAEAAPGKAIFDNLNIAAAESTTTSSPTTTTTTTTTTAPTPAPTTAPATTASPGTVGSLTDNFDDNTRDASKWSLSTTGTGVSVAETGGRLQITPATNAAGTNYGGYLSVGTYSLANSAVFAHVVQGTSAGSGKSDTTMAVQLDSKNDIEMTLENNVLRCRTKVNGAFTHSGNVTYNATSMQWWRIREAAGTVYCETAPDNAGHPGTWTTVDHVADPAFNLASLHIGVDAGTYGAEAAPGKAIFDDLNIN
jgi:hypothetical protein